MAWAGAELAKLLQSPLHEGTFLAVQPGLWRPKGMDERGLARAAAVRPTAKAGIDHGISPMDISDRLSRGLSAGISSPPSCCHRPGLRRRGFIIIAFHRPHRWTALSPPSTAFGLPSHRRPPPQGAEELGPAASGYNEAALVSAVLAGEVPSYGGIALWSAHPAAPPWVAAAVVSVVVAIFASLAADSSGMWHTVCLHCCTHGGPYLMIIWAPGGRTRVE